MEKDQKYDKAVKRIITLRNALDEVTGQHNEICNEYAQYKATHSHSNEEFNKLQENAHNLEKELETTQKMLLNSLDNAVVLKTKLDILKEASEV